MVFVSVGPHSVEHRGGPFQCRVARACDRLSCLGRGRLRSHPRERPSRKGARNFWLRIRGGSYGGSPPAARDFSPAPENGTRRGTRGIRDDVPPIGCPAMREEWPRALGDEGPDREMEENFPAGRTTVMSAQTEPPLEPEHERQRGGDEQAIIEMSAHKWTEREVRQQQPAIHRVRRARREAERIAPVPERRDFQSSAKITAPDATARRSFRKRIMARCYARGVRRQAGNASRARVTMAGGSRTACIG